MLDFAVLAIGLPQKVTGVFAATIGFFYVHSGYQYNHNIYEIKIKIKIFQEITGYTIYQKNDLNSSPDKKLA
jgi:hypothetical protein